MSPARNPGCAVKLHMVAPHYPPNPQPMGRWVREVGVRLAEAGHEVVVHTRDQDPDGKQLPPREEIGSVTVRRYEAPVHLGDQVVYFDPKIEEGAVMLNGYGILVNDRVRDRYDGGPVFYHLHHGVDPPSKSLAQSLYQGLYNPLVASSGLTGCDGLLLATDEDRQTLLDKGVDEDEIHTAPYGVQADQIEGFADPSDRDLGDYIIFPGPLERSRRPTDLLEAIAGLSEGDVVFAGPDAPGARWIEHKIDDLGLGDRATVIRDPERAELAGLVRASRAVALPGEDGFPHPVLDAWCQGRPVIGARTGGVPWVVDEGRTGLLYPPRDIGALRAHIATVVGDEDQVERLGGAGHKEVQAYTWDKIADGVDAFLEEVT